MKTYVIVTGVVFALIAIAHAARMIAEPRVLYEPEFHLLTALTIGLSVWAWRLVRRST